MSVNAQHQMNVAVFRLLAGLDVVHNVPKEQRKRYWDEMAVDAREVITTWNSNRHAIINSLAASAAIEMREAGIKKRFPKLHRITPTDARVREYKMKLTDARPAISEDALNGSGRAWWNDFTAHLGDGRDPATATPEPAAPGTLRSGRLRTADGDAVGNPETPEAVLGPAEAGRSSVEGRRQHAGALRRPASSEEPRQGRSEVRKGKQPARSRVPSVPASTDGMDTDTTHESPPRRRTRSASRAARLSEAVTEDEDQGMTTDRPHTQAGVDTSRRDTPARRKRSRSLSTVAADVSDVEQQPALKSALKRPRKMQRVIQPAGRRQKQPRGQGKSRATSVVSTAATDDDAGQQSTAEVLHTGVNLVAGLAPDVDAIVEEMISEEDWHVGPTLSRLWCTSCKSTREEGYRHKCDVYFNPGDSTSSARCIRCIRQKLRCDLAPRFNKGTKTTSEILNSMLLLLKVAEERYSEDLLLPSTFGDAALMATARHPEQNTPAPPEDPFELTDGEDDMEWWHRTRKSSSSNASKKTHQSTGGRGRGRPIARGRRTGKHENAPARKAPSSSTSEVQMRTRASHAKRSIPAGMEGSSGEPEASGSRTSTRRVRRIEFREPNNGNWRIINSMAEFVAAQPDGRPKYLCGGADWLPGSVYGSRAFGNALAAQQLRVKTDPDVVSDEGLDDIAPDDASTGPQTDRERTASSSDSLRFSRLTLHTDVTWDPPLPLVEPEWHDMEPLRDYSAFEREGATQATADDEIQVDEPLSSERAVALSAPEVETQDTGIQARADMTLSESAVQTPLRVMLNAAVQTDLYHHTGQAAIQTDGLNHTRGGIPSVQWGWARYYHDSGDHMG
ncbi:hypothetical protein BDW22DRAFT_1344042 [Trametopsis cervina]|nr:hypothetical protein BDW22DRAFT_1344042 [Trametopsis cervina]